MVESLIDKPAETSTEEWLKQLKAEIGP